MTISEAITKAQASPDKIFVAREIWTHRGLGSYRVKILATNTPDTCILFSAGSGRQMHRGWQPSADDLTANDWIITE